MFSRKTIINEKENQSFSKTRKNVHVGLLTIIMLILVSFGGRLLPVFTSTALAKTYTFNDATNEAYWYSRYNLGHLVMMSGMGIQFMWIGEWMGTPSVPGHGIPNLR